MAKFYLLKLNPPRPTFSQDMSPDERSVMQQHITYWTGLMNEGHVLAFGPVLDPAGVYGVGIIEADSDEQVKKFMENDPAIEINTYEYYPMLAVTPPRS